MWLQCSGIRDRADIYFDNYKIAKRNFINRQKEAIIECKEKFYDELNKSASCDMRLFWRLIRKRQNKRSDVINEIPCNDKTIRDPTEIAHAFHMYYKDVFTPKVDEQFDKDFQSNVSDKMTSFLKSKNFDEDDILTGTVSSSEIDSIIKSLNKRKAPGADNIVNEHLIHGGNPIILYLQKLFALILKTSHVPKACKLGVIIPIPKQGKSKT